MDIRICFFTSCLNQFYWNLINTQSFKILSIFQCPSQPQRLKLGCTYKVGQWNGKISKHKKKSTHEFFICLLVINEKHMNSHFVLCHFENLCFGSNALKMASVSTHTFLKSGPETVHDLPQHLHRICSHFILNSLF